MGGRFWMYACGAGMCLLAGVAWGQVSTAMQELIRAADSGSDVARMRVAVAYESGQGLAHDEVRALHYYDLAARSGFAPAQGHLGILYRDGRGTPADQVRAYHWLRLAAKQADAGALRALAQAASQGQWMAQDAQKAMYLYMSCAVQPLHAAWNGGIDLSVMDCRSTVGQIILQHSRSWEAEQHGLLFLQQALDSYDQEVQAVQEKPEFAASLASARKVYEAASARLTAAEAMELQRLLARHDAYFLGVRNSLPAPQALLDAAP